MFKTMDDYIGNLKQKGKSETARGYKTSLERFAGWLRSRETDPLKATTEDIHDYRQWLADEYVSSVGLPLEVSTQVTCLSAVKAYYRWMYKRGLVAVDVSKKVSLPKLAKRTTQRDYLTLQETTAILQTQAAKVISFRKGSHRWAREHRTLTLLSVAISTGRRRTELRSFRLCDLNFKRNEIRCERVKGKPGRVLPVVGWAMAIVKEYVEEARPVLDWEEGNEWLFVGDLAERIGNETFNKVLRDVHTATVEQNPDLTDLADKHLTPHSLRVSYAKLLFNGGCDIRSVNELMMHERLSTTARYTPIPIEDLRRVCRKAHPRA